jgi:hypothetical protein
LLHVADWQWNAPEKITTIKRRIVKTESGEYCDSGNGNNDDDDDDDNNNNNTCALSRYVLLVIKERYPVPIIKFNFL